MKTSQRRQRRRSSGRKRPLRSVRHPLLGSIFVLRAGTTLYTGGELASRSMFLTPHRRLAQMYADLFKGEVHRFRTARPLRLVPKEHVVWALRKGSQPKGEWPGFGSDEGDMPVAAALGRRAESASSWLFGMDGWVHSYSSPTLGEVMLTNPDRLTRP